MSKLNAKIDEWCEILDELDRDTEKTSSEPKSGGFAPDFKQLNESDAEIEEWDDENGDGWGARIQRTSNAPKNEGFFSDFKQEKLPPDTAIRWAFHKRQEFLRKVDSLTLLLADTGQKKDREIIERLFNKYSATIEELQDLTEEESLTPHDGLSIETLLKRFTRLNKRFRDEAIGLEIVWERKRGPLNMERVWLDVRY